MPNFAIKTNLVIQTDIIVSFFSYSLWIKINPSSCENWKEKRGSVWFCCCCCYNAWNTLPPP